MNAKLLTWEEAVEWLRRQPEQQELVQHCYYDDPLERAAERFNQSEEWQAVKDWLKNYLPGKVLDLGAGRGISSYAFAKVGCYVTALEPDPSLLVGSKAIQSLVEDTQLPIQVIQEYGEKLPFLDNSFDIVYGRAVLHHAKDIKQFCQEAARVLKPGGVFIVTREHVISKKEDLPRFLEAHALQRLYGGENAYLLKEYKEAIETAGLKLQKAIGPFESPMNYAPMTQHKLKERICSAMARLLGKKLAQWLSAVEAVQHLFSWLYSKICQTPGRHYSFMAVKK